MELPSVASLTHMEATARVNFADGDDPSEYSPIYQEPFGFILEMAHHLPRANRGVAAPGCRYKNWEHWLDGYSEWGVPEEETGNLGLAALVRTMAVQHLYFTTDKPEIQLKKLFAAPVERSLAAFGATRACEELGQKVFVLKIEIHPMCTSTREDFCGRSVDPVIVWRLATCFGDTNLDSFHDQIIAPSFGWRRHYHSYQFFCPGSGAMLGPTKSDAIDMMHVGTKGQYMLDSEKYDVRHVLRKKGQRLGYIYDLGDGWLHMITVVNIVDKGTVLEKGVSSDPQINNVWDAQIGSKGVAVNGAQLLAGEVNCPPEDSAGCPSGMREYGDILSKPRSFVPTAFGVNWSEHGIRTAYDFDLGEHQKRFDKAVRQRKSPVDGALRYNHQVGSFGPGGMFGGGGGPSRSKFGGFNGTAPDFFGSEKGRKLKECHTGGHGAKEVVGKKTPLRHCHHCLKQTGSNSGITLKMCGGCKKVAFCGRSCQKDAWPEHKKVCEALKNEKKKGKK